MKEGTFKHLLRTFPGNHDLGGRRKAGRSHQADNTPHGRASKGRHRPPHFIHLAAFGDFFLGGPHLKPQICPIKRPDGCRGGRASESAKGLEAGGR